MIDYKKELNKSQYDAVTAKENRLLFLAGAGTGKTRTMIYRTSYLIDNGINPDNILLLTFTNKAADEMVSRLSKNGFPSVLACTFHSFCVKVLRRYSFEAGLGRNFNIITSSEAEQVVKMFRGKFKKIRPSEIVTMESICTNKGITLTDLFETEDKYRNLMDYIPEIEEIIQKSRQYRYENNALSYDDLLTRTIELLELNPDVAEHLRFRYTHIMIDEYQDTNILQERIIELINPENLAVVGDDCQSLYGFRGAEVHNIINFPKKFNAREIKLEKNYRSNQEILDLSNSMMETYSVEGSPKWLNAIHENGIKPVLYRAADEFDEANYVMDIIRKWLNNNETPSELCVLARTARTTNYLESLLAKEGISFEKRGGPKFIEQDHIQDVLSLFNLYRDNNNEIAWFRVLDVIRNIGDVNAKKIAKGCTEKGIDYLLDSTFKRRIFAEDIKGLHAILNEKHNDWHKAFASLCDYYIKLRIHNLDISKIEEYKKTELSLAIERNIKPDLNTLQEIANAYSSSTEFLDNLLTSNVSELEKTDKDKIIISTIHSAKGLEFDCVILMGASQGLFPKNCKDDELRCMYVALTRAKYFLFITSPVFVRTYEGIKKLPIPYCFNSIEDFVEKTGKIK